jgi:hypothetical protein
MRILLVVLLVVAPTLHWAGSPPDLRVHTKPHGTHVSWAKVPVTTGPRQHLVAPPAARSAIVSNVATSLPIFATTPFVPPER